MDCCLLLRTQVIKTVTWGSVENQAGLTGAPSKPCNLSGCTLQLFGIFCSVSAWGLTNMNTSCLSSSHLIHSQPAEWQPLEGLRRKNDGCYFPCTFHTGWVNQSTQDMLSYIRHLLFFCYYGMCLLKSICANLLSFQEISTT